MQYLRNQNFFQNIIDKFGIPKKKVPLLTETRQHLIYAASHGLYNQGDYKKAEDLFTQLIISDPYSGKYWKGIASCKQMQKKFEEALYAWSVCALIADPDPFPHFHAAECLISLEKYEEALKALLHVETCCLEITSHQVLKKRVIILKELIQKALQESMESLETSVGEMAYAY